MIDIITNMLLVIKPIFIPTIVYIIIGYFYVIHGLNGFNIIYAFTRSLPNIKHILTLKSSSRLHTNLESSVKNIKSIENGQSSKMKIYDENMMILRQFLDKMITDSKTNNNINIEANSIAQVSLTSSINNLLKLLYRTNYSSYNAFSIVQIKKALQIVCLVPLCHWNQDTMNMFIHICFRNSLDNFIIDILRSKDLQFNSAMIDSINYSNIRSLFSIKTIITCINEFSKLHNVNLYEYCYQLSKILMSPQNPDISISSKQVQILHNTYLSSCIHNKQFNQVIKVHQSLLQSSNVDMVSHLIIMKYFTSIESLEQNLSIWSTFIQPITDVDIYTMNQQIFQAYILCQCQMIKCYIKHFMIQDCISLIYNLPILLTSQKKLDILSFNNHNLTDESSNYSDIVTNRYRNQQLLYTVSAVFMFGLGNMSINSQFAIKILFGLLSNFNNSRDYSDKYLIRIDEVNEEVWVNDVCISSIALDSWIPPLVTGNGGFNDKKTNEINDKSEKNDKSFNNRKYNTEKSNGSDNEIFDDPFGSLLAGYLSSYQYEYVIVSYLGIISSISSTTSETCRNIDNFLITTCKCHDDANIGLSRHINTNIKSFNVYLTAIKELICFKNPDQPYNQNNQKNIQILKRSQVLLSYEVLLKIWSYSWKIFKSRNLISHLLLQNNRNTTNEFDNTDIQQKINVLNHDNITSKLYDEVTTALCLEITSLLYDFSSTQYLWNEIIKNNDKSEKLLCYYLRSFQQLPDIEYSSTWSDIQQKSKVSSIQQRYLIQKLYEVIPYKKLKYIHKNMILLIPLISETEVDDYLKIPLKSRALDEIIQAYLRIYGLPVTLELCSHIISLLQPSSTMNTDLIYNPLSSNINKVMNEFTSDSNSNHINNHINQKPIQFLSTSPITNCLIYYDRYWRDYNVDTVWDPNLKIAQSTISLQTSELSRVMTIQEESKNNTYRNIFLESKRLAYVLKHTMTLTNIHSSNSAVYTNMKQQRKFSRQQLVARWSSVCAGLMSRGLFSAAIDIFHEFEEQYQSIKNQLTSKLHQNSNENRFIENDRVDDDVSSNTPIVISTAIKLAIYSSILGDFPLLTAKAYLLHETIESFTQNVVITTEKSESTPSTTATKQHSISSILSVIKSSPYKLPSGYKRTICRVADIIDFLELGTNGYVSTSNVALTSDSLTAGLKSESDHLKDRASSIDNQNPSVNDENNTNNANISYKLPLPVSLLQSLFIEMITVKQFNNAARIIRLLAKSRLVIDIDPEYLTMDLSTSIPSANIANESASMIEIVRTRLAQKWVAMLLGKILNQSKAEIVKSIKRAASSNSN